MSDIVDRLIAFESGELDDDQTIELFQELVDTSLAWFLQGAYRRSATRLIDAGLVSAKSASEALTPRS